MSPLPWRGLAVGWAVVIAVLTLVPSDQLPPTPPWQLISFDTAAHAGVFVALALPLRLGWRWSWRWTTGAGVAYGALIELLQVTMHLGRHGEWSDLLSDTLGAALGAALAGWWLARPAAQPVRR